MPNATAVADQIESELAPLTTEACHAWWDLNVVANEENEQRRVELETALSDFLADGDRFAAIEGAREAAEGPARRRLDLLHNVFLRQQTPAELRSRIIELEASVEMRFSQHRGDIDGRPVDDNEIRRILKESDDVGERRAAWEASKTVGAAVADDVRELARLRNAAAHSLGFRDWFALSVATSEMDEEKLMATLDDADRATAEPFARWKADLDERLASRFGCAADDLRPWHYADAFFQEVPAEGGVDLDPFLESADLVEITRRTLRRDRARHPRACSTAATSSRATASASMRSASTSTAPATSACSRTSCRVSDGWTRCSTSSATPLSTPASTRRCRGSCATPISSSRRASRS